MAKATKKKELKPLIDVNKLLNQIDYQVRGCEFIGEKVYTEDEIKQHPTPSLFILGKLVKPSKKEEDINHYSYSVGERTFELELDQDSKVSINGFRIRFVDANKYLVNKTKVVNSDLLNVKLLDDCAFHGSSVLDTELINVRCRESEITSSQLQDSMVTKSTLFNIDDRKSSFNQTKISNDLRRSRVLTDSSIFNEVTLVDIEGHVRVFNSNIRRVNISCKILTIRETQLRDFNLYEDRVVVMNSLFDYLEIDLSRFRLPSIAMIKNDQWEIFTKGFYTSEAKIPLEPTEEEIYEAVDKIMERRKHTPVSKSIFEYVLTSISSRIKVSELISDCERVSNN